MNKIKVVFRKFKNNQIIALFPETYNPYRTGRWLESYMHIGQHSEADPAIVRETTLATLSEYAPLLKELQSIYKGYELIIGKKLNLRG
jgi:hypothetical protein